MKAENNYDRARAALIWDNHACFPLRTGNEHLPQLARYRDAGVSVVSLNIAYADRPWACLIAVAASMRRWISMRPEQFRLIASAEDIRECQRLGQLGIVFDVEGMDPVAGDFARVAALYSLGVRWLLIAYNRNNAAGGGCLDDDSGLTPIGRNIIDEMERVGMVLCLSHAGARTVAEAIEYCRNPPVFSHANPYSCHAHRRNVTDTLIRACAAKGGVFGVSGIGPYLGARNGLVEHMTDQLSYVIDLVGPAHVGLGLDYVVDTSELSDHVRDQPSMFPPDISGTIAMLGPEAIGAIAERLAQGNLSDAAIRGVLGENWMRVAAAVWK